MGIGKSGYIINAKTIIEKTRKIYQELIKIEDVNCLTKDPIGTIAFTLKNGDTYDLADFLRSKNFNVLNTINPAAISYTVTKVNLAKSSGIIDAIKAYIKDYSKTNKLFNKGIKDYYKDKNTLRAYAELKHEVPLEIQ